MNEFEIIKDAINAMRLESDPCYEVSEQNGASVKSINVRINGQLYFLMDYCHRNAFILRAISEIEDFPKYSLIIQNGHGIHFYHDKKEINGNNVDSVIELVFGTYEKQLKMRDKVAKAIKDTFKIDVPIDCIGYDLCDEKYYINDWKKEDGWEAQIIRTIFEKKKEKKLPELKNGEKCHIYKYTSLDTFMKMLTTQKIRMYSLPGMNDRKELGIITSNEDKASNNDEDWIFRSVMKEADKRFITCFTTKKDDLNMWRLYGDNAKGVCLIFEIDKTVSNLYPIIYNDESECDMKMHTEQLNQYLSQMGLSYKFMSMERKWQYFMKTDNFNYEDEVRLLVESDVPTGWDIQSSGVITPYIERGLFNIKSKEELFPLILKGVILGPNIKEQVRNIHQIELLAMNSPIKKYLQTIPSKHNYFM